MSDDDLISRIAALESQVRTLQNALTTIGGEAFIGGLLSPTTLQVLHQAGILSKQHMKDVLDALLLMLEKNRSNSSPLQLACFDHARSRLEYLLARD